MFNRYRRTFKLLKSGKSISMFTHAMQLLAVVSLRFGMFPLANVLIMTYLSAPVNHLFNLFRRSLYWEDISISYI
nr:MAG TPA: hypothetical protein [Caudoviricetes sp.]